MLSFTECTLTACFLGALQAVASKAGKAEKARDAKIHTEVHIGLPKDAAGFGLAVDIKVEGVADQSLIDEAHAVSRVVTSCASELGLLNPYTVLPIQPCVQGRYRGHRFQSMKQERRAKDPSNPVVKAPVSMLMNVLYRVVLEVVFLRGIISIDTWIEAKLQSGQQPNDNPDSENTAHD